jgi:hypothetical protein
MYSPVAPVRRVIRQPKELTSVLSVFVGGDVLPQSIHVSL